MDCSRDLRTQRHLLHVLRGLHLGTQPVGDRARHEHHARPPDPDYKWVDKGEVVSSVPEDDYNASTRGSSRTVRARRTWRSARTGRACGWWSWTGRPGRSQTPTRSRCASPTARPRPTPSRRPTSCRTRLLLPVHVLGAVLPGRGQRLQDHGRALEEGHRPVRGPGRAKAPRRRRHHPPQGRRRPGRAGRAVHLRRHHRLPLLRLGGRGNPIWPCSKWRGARTGWPEISDARQ